MYVTQKDTKYEAILDEYKHIEYIYETILGESHSKPLVVCSATIQNEIYECHCLSASLSHCDWLSIHR